MKDSPITMRYTYLSWATPARQMCACVCGCVTCAAVMMQQDANADLERLAKLSTYPLPLPTHSSPLLTCNVQHTLQLVSPSVDWGDSRSPW